MNFEQAFDELMKHEGGYVDHKDDKGGATRFGVTEAVAREAGYEGSMKDLPLPMARSIARRKYWDAVSAEQLPEKVRYAVFDAAYHSGPRQAIKWLQQAAGAEDDGVLGPKTLLAVQRQNQDALLRRLLAKRLAFLAGLSNWPAFGRGWARRVASIMEA